jgi:hypothetical protein
MWVSECSNELTSGSIIWKTALCLQCQTGWS